MDDENGCDLSLGLGLGLGGSTLKSKGKIGNSSENKTEEGDRSNKLVDDFKSFLHGSTQKQDPNGGSQASDSVKHQENFFNDLSKPSADASINLNPMGLWGSSSRPVDIEDESRSEVGNKRKLPQTETSNTKKVSHISITTEDNSTDENEDVAESEVDGSTSRFSVRPANTVGYTFPVRESSSIGVPAGAGHAMQGMMQGITTSNGEQRIGTQSSNSGNLQVMFGYSPIQLPTLDKDNSWGLVSHVQQVHPAYTSRGLPNSDKQNDGLRITPAAIQAIPRNSSEPTLYDPRTLDRPKGEGKHHITEEGSSTQTEDDPKGSALNPRAKDPSAPPITEGASFDFSAIKPGIASDLKFGGCGSYPNLPWVSTTGSGPNGRTISGVTYRFSANQIKIVCACHGSHMSPEDFVKHASDENTEPDNGGGLAGFPNPNPSSNPAASAQS